MTSRGPRRCHRRAAGAPFPAARRFAVTGGRLDATQAVELGLAHHYAADAAAADAQLQSVLAQIRKCAPEAVAVTKALMLAAPDTSVGELLDRGADAFAKAARGPEGVAGMGAFIQKQAPPWASVDDDNSK